MPVIDIIKQKLQESLNAANVEVMDESSQHAGHAGARPGGETHFAVTVISEKFAGLSRVQRHKLVYGILKTELENSVHALRIDTRTPEEK